MASPQLPAIKLTDEENSIFEAVVGLFETLAVATNLAVVRNVQLRVAGGWVRDKIMQKESNDIDIAVDEAFPVTQLYNMVKKHAPTVVENISIVYQNPAAGKQLDMVRMTIQNNEIEFVNLRLAKLSAESQMGRPDFDAWVDAMLRDLTINALFYNLRTRQVEDLTGYGVSDIQNKIIRTPLPPVETWTADPCRMVRVVRFAARLGFSFAPEIVAAFQTQPDGSHVSQMLSTISRERILIELEKMVTSAKAPEVGFEALTKFGLQSAMFDPPRVPTKEVWTAERSDLCSKCLALSLRMVREDPLASSVPEQLLVFILAGYFLPFSNAQRTVVPGAELAGFPFTKVHIKDVWKWPLKTANSVLALIEWSVQWARLADLLSATQSTTHNDDLVVDLGNTLKAAGDQWPWVAHLAKARLALLFGDPLDHAASSCNRLVDLAKKLKFVDGTNPVWRWQPLLKSEELISQLNLPKGPQVGEAHKAVFRWRLLNGGFGADRDRCLAYLKTLSSPK